MTELAATDAHVPSPAAAALAGVLEKYLADLQAGAVPDRAALLAAHPELEQCLAGLDFIHRTSHASDGTPIKLGDFRIVREVGRGGMGVVYEAVQESLGRRVALKVLRFGSTSDPEALARFRREAETVAGLHHTHIVPLFASGSEGGVHYFAMQYVEGRPLNRVLEEGQPLDPHTVANWGLQAAEALAHAHQRGIIHRDVKPSNLLLDGENNLWLTDFGLARRSEETALTVTGALMGTPRYMSPEQARATALPVDHRTDVYSLGATLYEMLAGRPVCDASTPQEMLHQIVNVEPPPLAQLRRGLARDLETIIGKCLAKEPQRRYATAHDLGEDLRAFLDGRPIKARRPTLAERVVRWLRQRRGGVTSSGSTVLALGFLTAASLLLWGWYQEWRQGSLVLTTEGPTLEAIVLEEESDHELARFKVPRLEPVKLPAGVYRVRLEESGSLSETYTVLVERGVQTSYNVALQHRRVGTPIRESALWPLQDVPTTEGRKRDEMLEETKTGLRRFRVDTGETIWESNLDAASQPALAKARHYDWRKMFHSPPGEHYIRHDQGDLDGDGVPDPVWVSKNPAGVLAVSGATGRVLWWRDVARRGHWPAPFTLSLFYNFKEGHGSSPPAAKWTTKPFCTDIDGDGVADVVAGFNYYDASRLEGLCLAVSGRTGRTLWRSEQMWGAYAPLELELDGKPVLLVCNGLALGWLDRRTGDPVRPETMLGFVARFLPVLLSRSGGAEPLILLVRKSQRKPIPMQRWIDHELVALRPSRPNEPLWIEPFEPPSDPWSGATWPQTADLDGDGSAEIILPTAWRGQGGPSRPHNEDEQYRYWSGLKVLGSDGRQRWQRGLWLQGLRLCEPPAEVHVGPDIDGDGQSDLFLASTGGHGREQGVMAEALSGADGRTLWWWQQQPLPTFVFSNTLGIVRPWKRGRDGHRMLAMQLMGSGGRPLIGVFEASTGRLMHTLPETGYLYFDGHDLSGNGLSALGYLNEERGNGFLEWVPGSSVERWRWLGLWQPMHDLNGDGVPDLVERERWQTVAISGQSGKKLWQAPIRDVYPFSDFRRFGGADWKLDKDAVGDILTLGPVGDGRFPARLHAHSGYTGELLWSSVDLRPEDSRRDVDALAVECGDWLNEGWPQLLLATTAEDVEGKEVFLTLLSGHDGAVRWRQSHGSGANPETLPMQVVPVPGRAVPVLVTFAQDRGEGLVLQGQDLASGARLWRRPVASQLAAGVFPPLLVTNWGGGPVVVVGVSGRVTAFDAADGRPLWEWRDPDGYSRPTLISSSVAEPGVWLLTLQEPPADRAKTERPPRLLWLDPSGKEVKRHVLPREQPDAVAKSVRAHDVDGDGLAEALLVGPRSARLVSLRDGKELWKRGLWGRKGELRELTGIGPGSLAVIQDGETVLGLELATNTVRWRCHGPGQWQGLLAGPAGEPPGIVFRADENASGTVCRDARGVDASGEWLPLSTKTLPGPPPRDPRRSRELPNTHREFFFFYAVNALWALVVVAGPLLWLLAWWRWRGWPWLVGLVGYLGLVVLAFTTELITDQVSWQQLAMASWFRGFYTDWMGRPDIDLRVLRIAAGIPVVAFVGLAIWWLLRRRWRLLLVLLGLSLVVAAVHASVDITVDIQREAEEYYAWADCWRYAFFGVHDMGLGLPPLLGLIAVVRWLWRRRRRSQPHH